MHHQRLLSLGHSDSQARELIATLLTFYIWHTKRGDAYTYSDYVAELERLLRLLLDFWSACEVPEVSATGKRLETQSAGKLGERIQQ